MLAERCAGDAELRRLLDDMLERDSSDESIFTPGGAEESRSHPSQVGRYKIVQIPPPSRRGYRKSRPRVAGGIGFEGPSLVVLLDVAV